MFNMCENGGAERSGSAPIRETVENGRSRVVLFNAESESVVDALARSDASRTYQTYYDEAYVFLALGDRASGPVTVIDLHDPDARNLTDSDDVPLTEMAADAPVTAVLFDERMFHGDVDAMIDHVRFIVREVISDDLR